jgi:hypothetical protein
MRRIVGTARIRATAARLTAALVAFASFAGQLVSIAHVADRRHVACPEHGELEELPSVRHAGEILRAETSFEDGAAPLEGHGHDHCVFASHVRHSSAATVRLAWVALALAPSAPPPLVDLAAPKQLRALYRLAPKTSPPA